MELQLYSILVWEINEVLIYTTRNVLSICSAFKLLPVPVKSSIKYSFTRAVNYSFLLLGLVVFSEVKPASEFSEGMLWMDDRGISVSVLVSHVDSVSLVQLSR